MNVPRAKPILIIQTAFIGDTILASNFAAAVQRAYPDADLHFLLRKGNESVIQGLPFVKKVWVWDKGEGKVRSLVRLIRELRHFDFEAVFNLHRHFNSGLVTALVRARHKVGFRENPLSIFYTRKVKHRIPHWEESEAWHETKRNLQLLKVLREEVSIPSSLHELRPILPIQSKHREKVLRYQSSPYVVLAPASVWFTKQWPEASYRELVARLSHEIRVYLIGGPGDRALCDRVKGEGPAINLCGELNLLESAALMAGAQRVFVNDSGPLHLASAVNAPTTAFFCATVPAFGYGPLADRSLVLESPTELACRPCGLHGHHRCPQGHFQCAENIKVSSAFATLCGPTQA